MRYGFGGSIALIMAAAMASPASAQDLIEHAIRPSAADARVTRFDDPSIAGRTLYDTPADPVE